MSNVSQNETAKSVRIPMAVWEKASHESIDRRCSMQLLFTVAWGMFAALPESKREKLVREFEEESKTQGAA